MAATRPQTGVETETYLTMAETYGRLQDEFAVFFKGHGLSQATYNVLRILRGAQPDGLCCGEIGERMVQRVPDVTRLVDRLEKQGLVARARDGGDRRMVIVKIGKAGLDLLAALDGPVEALHRRQLGHLKKSELDQLCRLLQKAGAGA